MQEQHPIQLGTKPLVGTGRERVRPLGSTTVQVGPISVGTAALGGLYRSVTDQDATDMVEAALAAGLRYFDTAPQYGHGTSEVRLGRALRGRDRDSYVLSSKVGRLVHPAEDGDTGIFADAPSSNVELRFDRESILRSLEESLQRLDVDRLDVVYIHDPDEHADQAIDEAYPVLHELRDAGVIRAIGVGMNQSAIPTRFVEETDIDVVLLAGRYTLLDQTGARDLIPAARRRGVSIVIGGVFNSGILADPDSSPMFDYSPAPAAIIERTALIRTTCERHGVALARAAVAFPLREPVVATVLMGARDRAELEQNLSLDLAGIPEDLWTDLAEQGLVAPHEG